MKDALFRWWQRLSKMVYIAVTGLVYTILSRRKAGYIPLNCEEKKAIRTYWKQHFGRRISVHEYGWYKSQGIAPDPRLIPDVVWHAVIEPSFTNLELEKGFADKNYFEAIIGREHSPITLCRCINHQLLDRNYRPLNVADALSVLKEEEELICKPSLDTGGGRGIAFIRTAEMDEEKILALINQYNGNFIIQEIISQHSFMSGLNSSSINTIRITTFLYKNTLRTLCAALRIGGSDSRVDNFASGGHFVPLTQEGKMYAYGLQENKQTREFSKSTKLADGRTFEGMHVPSFGKIG